MATITVKQLLHRVSPGVAIGPANPLEVRPYGGEGEPLELATESTLDDVKTAVESIAEEDFATQTTLAALKTEIDKLTALISDSRLKTEATLTGRTVTAVTLHNAVEIRDASQHSAVSGSISPAARFVFLIRSTLDQAVTVRITQPNGLGNSTDSLYNKDGNTLAVTTTVGANRLYVLDPGALGAPNLLLTSCRLVALCQTPPTSGSLSTYLMYLPN